MATTHDLAEGFQLLSTSGWATLVAILQESGEQSPHSHPTSKRPAPSSWRSDHPNNEDDDDDVDHGAVRPDATRARSDERLAKRIKGVSLNE